MIDIRDIRMGNYLSYLIGDDKLSMPMSVCFISEGEVCLTFDGNEADPWYIEPITLMPIAITGDILKRNGWSFVNGLWVKRGPLRLGWNESKAELIVGYHTLPMAVEFVHQLQNILWDFGIEDKITI